MKVSRVPCSMDSGLATASRVEAIFVIISHQKSYLYQKFKYHFQIISRLDILHETYFKVDCYTCKFYDKLKVKINSTFRSRNYERTLPY